MKNEGLVALSLLSSPNALRSRDEFAGLIVAREKFGSRSCGKVDCASLSRICCGVSDWGPPAASKSSAANAAAFGAAALVPKKLGNPSLSESAPSSGGKNEVSTPSAAANS